MFINKRYETVNSYREKDHLEQAKISLDGRGFDVIIENASHANLGTDLTVIAPGARIVVRKTKGS